MASMDMHGVKDPVITVNGGILLTNRCKLNVEIAP